MDWWENDGQFDPEQHGRNQLKRATKIGIQRMPMSTGLNNIKEELIIMKEKQTRRASEDRLNNARVSAKKQFSSFSSASFIYMSTIIYLVYLIVD